MDSIASILPPHEGLLPKWLFFVSVVSAANSIQAYTTLKYTQRVYLGRAEPPQTPSAKPEAASPVTPLSARTFGTWTMITSIIRMYAAYNITDPAMYQLAIWTYVVAWAHFMSEWFVFKTTRWGAGLAGPVVVSTASLLWMGLQWGWYVK